MSQVRKVADYAFLLCVTCVNKKWLYIGNHLPVSEHYCMNYLLRSRKRVKLFNMNVELTDYFNLYMNFSGTHCFSLLLCGDQK
jgi:hypothetical protein